MKRNKAYVYHLEFSRHGHTVTLHNQFDAGNAYDVSVFTRQEDEALYSYVCYVPKGREATIEQLRTFVLSCHEGGTYKTINVETGKITECPFRKIESEDL